VFTSEGHTQLIDFGTATVAANPVAAFAGTAQYLPPEVRRPGWGGGGGALMVSVVKSSSAAMGLGSLCLVTQLDLSHQTKKLAVKETILPVLYPSFFLLHG